MDSLTQTITLPTSAALVREFETYCANRGKQVQVFSTDESSPAMYGETTLSTFEIFDFAYNCRLDADYHLPTDRDLALMNRVHKDSLAFIIFDRSVTTETKAKFYNAGSEAQFLRFLVEENHLLTTAAEGGFVVKAPIETVSEIAPSWNRRTGVKRMSIVEPTQDGGTFIILEPNLPHVSLRTALKLIGNNA